jgi:hypothetical protein
MKEMTKSMTVSKRMVYESYLIVCSKGGGAGIDEQSIEMFNAIYLRICTGFGIAWHLGVIFHHLYEQYLFQRNKEVNDR